MIGITPRMTRQMKARAMPRRGESGAILYKDSGAMTCHIVTLGEKAAQRKHCHHDNFEALPRR
jgi:hypothetical protein